MLTVETLMLCFTVVVGIGTVFYMGVKTGKKLQYKEVQKVSRFLGVLMERKIFESEAAANAAYVVSQWFAGRLEDLNSCGPYDIWDEERDTNVEEKKHEEGTDTVLDTNVPVGAPSGDIPFDD
jgi:hypothetical protein